MASPAKTTTGVVVALVGAALAVVGLWFTSHLGTSGSGEFTARPSSPGVYVVDPTVLNRIDTTVRVTAEAEDGQHVWIGVTTPSDAEAILARSARTTVTGVVVRDWALTTTRTGRGEASGLVGADLWQRTSAGEGRASLAVGQDAAPQTVVVADGAGQPVALSALTLTWERGTWFFQALVLTLVGLIVLAVGAVLAWPGRPRRTSPAPARPDTLEAAR